ncbi:hypothetical protein [Lysinibacillus sp. LZ02]|uniref:hypothetical protein n=1 Tax=Lysinibacillus sp. LZ02 TaxID=3420668 RepID=UPI003D35C3EB
MFEVGQWVSYRQTPAFILEANNIEKKYLIQAPKVSKLSYWIPEDYLRTNEEVQLLEEDIYELKVVAIKTGDLQWYRELSQQYQ